MSSCRTNSAKFKEQQSVYFSLHHKLSLITLQMQYTFLNCSTPKQKAVVEQIPQNVYCNGVLIFLYIIIYLLY